MFLNLYSSNSPKVFRYSNLTRPFIWWKYSSVESPIVSEDHHANNNKKAIKVINFNTNGFGADSEILIDATQKKLKISEEKVTVIYNTGGRTSTKNPISHTSEVVASVIENIALRHPLKYLGIPGIVLIFTSIVLGINLSTTFNETGYFSIPITLIVLGTLLVGTMMILMSILLYTVSVNNIKNKN